MSIQVMRAAYPAAFLVMIGEALWRGAPSIAWIARRRAGVRCGQGAEVVGDRHAGRCLDLPGHRRARHDARGSPVRIAIVAHPNYVAVVGELVGVALLTGARVSGPLATAGVRPADGQARGD